MGRNKFEDQIKEKFVHREITPSAGSWDKLSGQLHSEEKKKTFSLWWIGIAATILGAIFIAGFVYNSNFDIHSPGIVETPVEVKLEDNKEPFFEETIAAAENVMPDLTGKDDSTPVQQKTPYQVKNVPDKILIAEVKNENSPEDNEEILALHDEVISQKLEEIIAEASLKDQIEGEHDMNEIDALLYKAASEISLERSNISTSGNVDANDLLFAVEMELEEGFREKVFDILKESYLKARTAVANRNNK